MRTIEVAGVQLLDVEFAEIEQSALQNRTGNSHCKVSSPCLNLCSSDFISRSLISNWG